MGFSRRLLLSMVPREVIAPHQKKRTWFESFGTEIDSRIQELVL